MRSPHTLARIGFILVSLLWNGGAAAQTSFITNWSSYVGGDWGTDGVYAIAADSATNSYIGGFLGQGWIQSDPAVDATLPYTYQGAQDAFVAKLTVSNTVAWYICLGGQENDRVTGLAAGLSDRLFASGFSERTALNDGGTDAKLWAVNRSTGSNTWTVSVGRPNTTNALTAVATDTNGNIYAVGYTSLTGLSHNVSGYLINGTNYGTQLKGDLDACVMKVAANGSMVWFHYLGGVNADAATACAVTPDGSVYVAGETRSPDWVSSPSGTPGPANKDGFLVKLTAEGTHVWSTLLSGSGSDAVAALTANPAAHTLFVAGSTGSSDFLSDTSRLNAYAGGSDGFVAMLTDSGATFTNAWCRFIGGSASDRVTSLALLTNGLSVAGGATASGGWLPQAGGSTFGGVQDGFLCALDSAGAVKGSSYIGGADSDEVRALFPLSEALLTAGSTLSSGWVSGGFWGEWNKIDAEDFGFVGKWLTRSVPGEPPVISGEPVDLSVQEGQPAAFHVAATGSAPLTYRWFRNGAAVTDLTSNTYVLASAALTNNADRYACLVSNAFGTATSREAVLTVTPKPHGTLTVSLAPAEAVAQGAAWSVDGGLTWLAAGGGTNLAEGLYTVTFKPVAGWTAPADLPGVPVLSAQTTSRSGTYTGEPPAISGEPVDLSVQEGRPAAFHVAATGTAPLTYRWLRNGAAVTDLTSNTYILASAALTNNADRYACLVSNAFGTAASREAVLTVTPKPHGTLTVSLAPAEAVAQGAAWSVDGGLTWLAGGGGTNLAEGLYTVTFRPVARWTAPADLAGVPVLSAQTTSRSGAYTFVPAASRAITGSNVVITVQPPAGTVMWQLNETLPPGLAPVSSSPGLTWDAAQRKLSITVGGTNLVALSYTVSGANGIYAVTGSFSYVISALVTETVGGDALIILGNVRRRVEGTSVTVTVVPPATNLFVWSVEETLPAGLTPQNLTGPGAAWNPSARTLTWVLLGSTGATLTYDVTGTPGTYALTGRATFGGPYEAVFGDSSVTVPQPPVEIPSPDILSLTPVPGSGALQLAFISVTGQAYVVQTNATLNALNWANGLPVTGDDGTTLRQVPIAGPQLFYRVRVVE